MMTERSRSLDERFVQVQRAFRFYSERYEFWQQFDRGLTAPQRTLLKSLGWVPGLGPGVGERLLRRIRSRLDRTLSAVGDLAVAFSRNQFVAAAALADLGLIRKVLTIGTSPPQSKMGAFDHVGSVSPWELNAVASTCAKEVQEVLNRAASHPVLHNNSARVVKGIAVARILDQLETRHLRNLVLLNDHEPYSTLAHDWAARLGLPTVYVQHAPVNPSFPPLHHDLNVLFSQHSLDCYGSGSQELARAILLFDIRMLPGLGVARCPDQAKLLVCTNPLDEYEAVCRTVEQLSDRWHVIHRPHPRDRRRWPEGARVTVSSNPSIWEDLTAATAVVGNETAVVLEALVSGRPFYKAAHWAKCLDNYGFLERGLLRHQFSNDRDLCEALERCDDPVNLSQLEHYVGPIREPKEREARLKALQMELDALTTRSL